MRQIISVSLSVVMPIARTRHLCHLCRQKIYLSAGSSGKQLLLVFLGLIRRGKGLRIKEAKEKARNSFRLTHCCLAHSKDQASLASSQTKNHPFRFRLWKTAVTRFFFAFLAEIQETG